MRAGTATDAMRRRGARAGLAILAVLPALTAPALPAGAQAATIVPHTVKPQTVVPHVVTPAPAPPPTISDPPPQAAPTPAPSPNPPETATTLRAPGAPSAVPSSPPSMPSSSQPASGPPPPHGPPPAPLRSPLVPRPQLPEPPRPLPTDSPLGPWDPGCDLSCVNQWVDFYWAWFSAARVEQKAWSDAGKPSDPALDKLVEDAGEALSDLAGHFTHLQELEESVALSIAVTQDDLAIGFDFYGPPDAISGGDLSTPPPPPGTGYTEVTDEPCGVDWTRTMTDRWVEEGLAPGCL
jgi:hypothetical protein